MSFWPGKSASLGSGRAAWYAPALLSVSGRAPGASIDTPATRTALVYRPDIDGLRAVAVTMVIAYHVAPRLLPGGFIGVDIFFVISGYLITELILSGMQRSAFSLAEFYARRVRRIVPALLVVLGASFALGWLTLLPNEFRWFGTSILWCAPFLANVFFAHAIGYFDPGADYNLLLHLWSLGVEEQFYLLWPVLLVLAVRHRVTIPVLGAVIATSLAISVWGARHAPVAHFFLPGARAWELAVGAMLAAWQLARGDTRAVRPAPARGRSAAAQHASLTGAAVIAAGAGLLNGDLFFPGAWGAIPVAGAALLIGAGPYPMVNRALLGSAPLVFVGRLSYSLYLWHWPMFAFARAFCGPELPATLIGGLIAATFAAALISYHWVEVPLRGGGGGRWAVPALLAALLGFTALGAAVSHRQLACRLSGPAFTAWDAAVTDWQIPRESMVDGQASLDIPALHTRRAATVLFIGDSHMQQYWPRITAVVAAHPDGARSVLFAAYAGCPILPSMNSLRQPRRCDAFFAAAARQALQPRVDTVVFGAFWELYLLGEYSLGDHQGVYSPQDPLRGRLGLDSHDTQVALAEFEQLVAALVASGRRVFIVLSNPTSPQFDPRWLVPVRVRFSPRLPLHFRADLRMVDVTAFEAFVAPLMNRLRDIATHTGAQVLDPRSTLCADMRCPAVAADGTSLYIDSNHLRAAYARERAGFLDRTVLEPPGQ
ncbi:MAG TPA: acyltransferase family protein [Steroidobacteraceae bacterium]|nr:acyltransferase family protein [Steroidobacteraceae bacterium]